MSGVVNEEGDEVMVTTAADLVARAFETFFRSSAATFDVVTYRTLSRENLRSRHRWGNDCCGRF